MTSPALALALALALACAGKPSDPATVEDGGATSAGVGLQDIAVALHPEIGSLLQVSWTQAGAGEVEIEVQVDGAWRSAPVRVREAGAHELLIPGVPFDHDTAVRLRADGQTSEELALRTAALPEGLPAITLLAADPAAFDPAVEWLLLSINEAGTNYGGPWWTLILDRQARVVWALATDRSYSTLWAQPARDGTSLLIDQNSFWTLFDEAATSHVLRVGLDGRTRERLQTPGMGHAWVELPDGRIAWPGTIGDRSWLYAVDGEGRFEELWDCDAFMGGLGRTDACGANSVTHDEATGSLIFSFFSSEAVLQLDLATLRPTRWFGHIPSDWSFADPQTTFWWQHGAVLTGEGTLLLSTRRDESAEETVLREYRLDESTRQLEQIWSFGEGAGLYAPTLGEGHRLPGGNTLQNLGSYARLREATPEGEVVWEVDLGGPHQFLGRSLPLPDLWALAEG